MEKIKEKTTTREAYGPLGRWAGHFVGTSGEILFGLAIEDT